MRLKGVYNLITLVVLAACDTLSDPLANDAVPSSSVTSAESVREVDLERGRRPGDDPRAYVFEELGPRQSKFAQLSTGECVLQYRRANGKYTPFQYRLHLSRTASQSNRVVAVVKELIRNDTIGVRALCLIPGTPQAIEETDRDLARRMTLPALERAPDGSLRLFVPPPPGRFGGLIDGLRQAIAIRFQLGRLAESVAMLVGPAPVQALQDEIPPPEVDCDEDPYHPSCPGAPPPYELPPIDVPGEDPCDDELGRWDEALQACVCWNGLDWENGCEPPDIPPGGGDDDNGGGGGGGGGPSTGGDDDDGDGIPDNDPMNVSLTCTPTTVVRGDQVNCVAQMSSGPLMVQNWVFRAADGDSVVSISSNSTWGGVMVKSGTIIVRAIEGQSVGWASVDITVQPRSWSWSSNVNAANASPGQLDNCFLEPEEVGLTLGTDCARSLPATRDMLVTPASTTLGYSISQASGPNAGFYYITNPTTVLHLRAQINRRYRQDGPAHSVPTSSIIYNRCAARFGSTVPPLSVYTVNTECYGPSETQFSSFQAAAWAHEGLHLQAGLTEAQKAENDLYAQWEPVVAKSAAQAQMQAAQILSLIHNRIADKALATHNDQVLQFIFYRFRNAWVRDTVHVGD